MSDEPRDVITPTETAGAPIAESAPPTNATSGAEASDPAAMRRTVLPRREGRPPVMVRLERFEGPLDLLLHLIKRDEVDIYDIPIAHITRQYLAYLDLMRSFDLEVAGEFLVMAATLMRIKAKMLLPLPAVGEEEDEGDPREELVQRLVEYRQFKEAAGTLKGHEEVRRQLFERGMLPGEDEAGPLPLAPATLFDLLDALDRVLARTPQRVTYDVQSEVYDVEDKMAYIIRVVAEGGVAFSTLMERCRDRGEIIVTFMALLELIKLGGVLVVQTESFGEISIVAREPGGNDTNATAPSASGA